MTQSHDVTTAERSQRPANFLTHPAAVVAGARREPTRVAVRFKREQSWVEWTRIRLVEAVAAAARSLLELGLQTGDRVGVFAPSGVDWYIAALGVQSAGGIVVGAYPTSATAQIEYLFAHSGARFVFAGNADQARKVHAIRTSVPIEQVIVFDPSSLAPDERSEVLAWEDFARVARRGDDAVAYLDDLTTRLVPSNLCTIVYTSGTTGDPKGAMHSFETIGQVSYTVAPALGYTESDDYLVYLPMNHTAEQANSLVCGSALGWTLNFGSLETLAEDLLSIRPTVMFAVPRVIEKLRTLLTAQSEGSEGRDALTSIGLERMRILLAGGAPLAADVLSYFADFGLLIRNGYGMTEGGGICMPWATPPRTDTVGTPLPGVEMKLADDGEVLIRSSGLCLGYYRDEATSAEIFDDDGFLRTGDVGEWSDDGELRLIDRKKDLIITKGGKNIAPSGIEHMLKLSPYINQAILIGSDRPYVVALFELAPEAIAPWAIEHHLDSSIAALASNADVRALLQLHVDEVNDHLSPPEQVKRFAILPSVLAPSDPALTPTMKIRRSAFTDRYRDLIDALYT
ncbi:MAG: AMP-binding protein [Acidimicrobiales bacterium]